MSNTAKRDSESKDESKHLLSQLEGGWIADLLGAKGTPREAPHDRPQISLKSLRSWWRPLVTAVTTARPCRRYACRFIHSGCGSDGKRTSVRTKSTSASRRQGRLFSKTALRWKARRITQSYQLLYLRTVLSRTRTWILLILLNKDGKQDANW